MHLALACVIRARHELYVYYISDVKFLGYVLTTLFVIILFNFALNVLHMMPTKSMWTDSFTEFVNFQSNIGIARKLTRLESKQVRG
jgi:hypothetical protein